MNRSRTTSYLIGPLATLAALIFALIISRSDPMVTYSVFLGAIMVGVWNGGVGPGLLTAILSEFAIQMFIEPQPLHFNKNEAVRLALFLVTALVIGYLNARSSFARAVLRELNEKLEHKIELRNAELSKANASLRKEMGLREEAFKARAATNARYRALLAAIPDLMIRVNREGILLELVSAKNVGPSPIQHENVGKLGMGKHIREVLSSDVAELTLHAAQEVLTTHALRQYDITLRSDDGEKTMEARVVPCAEDEVLIIFRDVSELRRKETALRQLTERLTSAQEDERRRLSRSLHDESGQSLTTMIIRLARVERQLGPGGLDAPQLSAELAELRALAQSTHERLRATAHALHPSVLEHLGLAEALRTFVDELWKNDSINISADIPNDLPPFSPAQRISIYRIVQEGLTNALRHSGAKRISLRVYHKCMLDPSSQQTEQAVLFTITDDGCGFDFTRAQARGSFGLTSMRERAEMIGANFSIASVPGKGTTLVLCIPLNEAFQASSRNHGLTTS